MTGHLSETQESLTSADARLADRDEVLAQATSERTALSRAMEQNVRLKEQLIALQGAIDHVVSDSAVHP